MPPLEGIIGFPLTPFRDDLSLDLDRFEQFVAEIAEKPFCALNAPAGISEVFSLTPDEAVSLVERAARLCRSRIPLIGSVAFNLPIAAQMARRMEAAGADALLVLPPYYPSAPFEGLCEYYRGVARATGLPLAIYSRGWAVFSPDEVARLAEAIPTLRYWKDGQGDPRVYRRIIAKVGGRLTWIGGAGDDAAAVYAAIEVRCFTSSISGVSPELALAWGRAAMDGDLVSLNRLLDRYVHPLFALRARRRGYEVSAMKKARELLGRTPAGPARPPLPALAPADEADLRSLLAAWRDFL